MARENGRKLRLVHVPETHIMAQNVQFPCKYPTLQGNRGRDLCSTDCPHHQISPGDRQLKKGAALVALLLASCTRPAPDISVGDAWARATGPSHSASAVYLTITNDGGPDRLVGVSSPAGDASLHSTSTQGGVMRMRPVEAVEIPAGSTVTLEPGGTHVMLAGLEAPLAAGTTFPLMLDFKRSEDQQVEVTVRSMAADGDRT